jgi:hypothetical protein
MWFMQQAPWQTMLASDRRVRDHARLGMASARRVIDAQPRGRELPAGPTSRRRSTVA